MYSFSMSLSCFFVGRILDWIIHIAPPPLDWMTVWRTRKVDLISLWSEHVFASHIPFDCCQPRIHLGIYPQLLLNMGTQLLGLPDAFAHAVSPYSYLRWKLSPDYSGNSWFLCFLRLQAQHFCSLQMQTLNSDLLICGRVWLQFHLGKALSSLYL
jgi:hypothetical protein